MHPASRNLSKHKKGRRRARLHVTYVQYIRGMVGSMTVEALCRDKEARHAAWRAVRNTMEVIRRGFYTCLLPLITPIIRRIIPSNGGRTSVFHLNIY